MASGNPYDGLTFEDFRRLAQDAELSCHEKVGFPDDYRAGFESAIFADMLAKLSNLNEHNGCVLEIGPGCGPLPQLLADHCADQGHRLLLVDSAEMLAHFEEADHLVKLPGEFPYMPELLATYRAAIKTIVAYSVIQYPFEAGHLDEFIDAALSLLEPGGQMLLGDVPNVSMRRRFFQSEEGLASHREYTGLEHPAPLEVDDASGLNDQAVMNVLRRARTSGFHAWVVPQAVGLPMANRREDILIVRP